MNRKKVFRTIILIGGFFIAVGYGILIGKYEFFPFRLLKQLQDGTEESVNYGLKDSVYNKSQIRNLITVNRNNRDSLVLELNNIVFGLKNERSDLSLKITLIADELYTDMDNLDFIEEFKLVQSNNINSKGYIFHPKNNIKRLLIYHQGHDGDFILGKNTIAFFVEKGFTVYAFSMPLLGKNNNPIVNILGIGRVQLFNHEEIKYLDYPLQYFINPVSTMVNYAEQFEFKDISMVGISGGGWTTTLVAALDKRVQNSFPVAGTLPLFVKFQKYEQNYGDLEQTFEPLLSKINYLDMYLLGATGKNRKQLQILNKYDPCCFNGEGYLQYGSLINEMAKEFDFGDFNVIADTLNQEHSISNWSLDKIWKVLEN